MFTACGRTDSASDAGVEAGPVDKTAACAEPNFTHLAIELTINGAVYRMVVDVNDMNSPLTIHFKAISRPLSGGAWAEGWRTGLPLDYVSNFDLHSADFQSLSTDDAVARLTNALDSAHLVHRNRNAQDGAIVVDLEGTPSWLLLNFSNSSF